MSCIINSGFVDVCRGSAGGVSTVWLGNFPSGITQDSDWLDIDPVTGIITGFTYSGLQAFEYKPNKTSSQFTETYKSSLENGSFGNEQKVTLVFPNMSQAKQNQIKLMSAGELFIIVKDKNGKYWLVGSEDGAVLSGGSADSGKVLEDGNKYTLEFTAVQGTLAKEVTAGAVASII